MRAAIICAIACAMLAVQTEAAAKVAAITGKLFQRVVISMSRSPYTHTIPADLLPLLPVTKYTTITKYGYTGELPLQ